MAGPIDLLAYKDSLLMLGAAAALVPAMRRLKVSPIIGFIVAGAALGPSGLGSFTTAVPWLEWITVTDARTLTAMAELGVVFLLFLIGLELTFERLTRMKRMVFGLGSAQVVACAAALGGLAALLGQPMAAALVIGLALAMSSTSIIIEHLAQERRLASATGRAAFAVLLLQDLAVIPIIIAVTALAAHGGGGLLWPLGVSFAQALLFIVVTIIVGRFVLRPFFRFVALDGKQEVFMAAALVVVIGAGVAAAAFGATMALGAFLAGLLLAETEYRRAIEATIEPFKALLLGVFFFSVGFSLNIGAVAGAPLTVAALVIGMVIVKLALIAPLMVAFGQTWRVGFRAGLLLGPAGEFTFVVLGIAIAGGLLPTGQGALLVAATAIGMALIPMLDRLGARLLPPLAAPSAIDAASLGGAPNVTDRRVIVVGYGRVGQLVCAMLKHHGIAYVAIDSDPREVAYMRAKGHDVYFGDAANPAFLQVCGVREAAALVVTIHTAGAVDDIARLARSLRPDLTVVARARDADHAKALYRLGVTDAVPETIEASLQLSEAVLFDIGVPAGLVIASVHERREAFRKELQADAEARAPERRAIRARRTPR